MLMGDTGNALDALDKYAHSPRIETVTLRYLSASSIATAMTSLQQLPVLTLLSLEDNDQRSLSQVRHPVSNPNHPIRIKQIACSEALKVLRDDAARGCAQLDVLLPLVNLTLMFVSNPVMNVKWFAFRFPALKIHRPPTPFDAGLAAAASGAHTPILLQEVRSSSWLKLSAKDPLRIRHFSSGRAALHPRRLQPCPSHTTHPTHQLVFRLGGSTFWSPHPASRSNARTNPTALRQVLNRLPRQWTSGSRADASSCLSRWPCSALRLCGPHRALVMVRYQRPHSVCS
jgi:hypothetical protein